MNFLEALPNKREFKIELVISGCGSQLPGTHRVQEFLLIQGDMTHLTTCAVTAMWEVCLKSTDSDR